MYALADEAAVVAAEVAAAVAAAVAVAAETVPHIRGRV